ncbi:MAG: hypothetical protein JWO79_1605 [Actinomycetia bacterium]|nr:hypothetical protein [Actinomycetes bacterium]MDQ1655505.1 hypothetical protein [Cryptosporangiaceae bacterium]
MNPTFARPVSTLAALIALTGSAAACTSGHPAGPPPEVLPSAAAFHTGACRDSAPAVLAVAQLAARYRGKKTIPAADRKKLAEHQTVLATQAKTAAEQVKKPLADLVTSIGFVRLRYASRSYDPTVLDHMDSARKAVQKACTG